MRDKQIEKVKLVWVSYAEVSVIRKKYSTPDNPIKMCSWGQKRSGVLKFGFYIKEDLLGD